MVSPLQILTVDEHEPLGRSPPRSRRDGEGLLEIVIDLEKSIKSLLQLAAHPLHLSSNPHNIDNVAKGREAWHKGYKKK